MNTVRNGFVWKLLRTVAFVVPVKSQVLLSFCFKQSNSWGSRMYRFVENSVSISEALISREIQHGYKKIEFKI